MRTRFLPLRLSAALTLAVSLPGCMAAAAGAGAAAAIAYDERGVSTKVQGTPAQVFERSQAAFADLGITQTGYDNGDGDSPHELKGRKGDLDITVHIKREDASLTAVDVYAQENALEYDRAYARRVLEAIMAQ